MDRSPRTEKVLNVESLVEQKVDQPLTIEDLKKRREDLGLRVAAIIKKKEDDIAKQLTDREEMIAEVTRLVPLMEEAEGTLEYLKLKMNRVFLRTQKMLLN